MSFGKQCLPLGAGGGSASSIYHQLLRDSRLSGWMTDDTRE
jgi:hypothetical protein